MTQEVYVFEEQVLVEDWYATILDDYFRAAGWNVIGADAEEQRQGIDRILVNPEGSKFTAQYKGDLRAETTGNLFMETWSVSERNVPGWCITTQAQYVIDYVPGWSTAFVIPTEQIQNHLSEWSAKYKEVPIRNEKDGRHYTTKGIAVPLCEFMRLKHKVLTISQP